MGKVNKSLEYTCIFGGGAVRGMSYVGALKALEKIGIYPTTIAGSSVGAVVAGLLAVGYNAEELVEVFMQVNFELFRDIHFGFGKDFAISKGGIFLDWLRELIEKKYYGENYIMTDMDKYYYAVPITWYLNYYQFGYTTSIATAYNFLYNIKQGKADSIANYIQYLKTGTSDYPIEILKASGVDITTSEPYDKLIEYYEDLMEELAILNKSK